MSLYSSKCCFAFSYWFCSMESRFSALHPESWLIWENRLSYSPTEMRKNNSLPLNLCLSAKNGRQHSVHYASVSGLVEIYGGSHLYPQGNTAQLPINEKHGIIGIWKHTWTSLRFCKLHCRSGWSSDEPHPSHFAQNVIWEGAFLLRFIPPEAFSAPQDASCERYAHSCNSSAPQPAPMFYR